MGFPPVCVQACEALPADAPAEGYAAEFGGAGTIALLESDAPEIALESAENQ